MIKETKILKEETIRLKFCDVCGTEIRIGLACSKATCEYCGKDLCEKCIGNEEDTMGDYRIVFCQSCSEIEALYKPKIEALEKEIDLLYDELKAKCKQKYPSPPVL